jgi:hypothetical protein
MNYLTYGAETKNFDQRLDLKVAKFPLFHFDQSARYPPPPNPQVLYVVVILISEIYFFLKPYCSR